jgi:regulator of nucleoside diphosphate kinase
MKRTNQELILMKEDYQLLTHYLHGLAGKTAFDRKNVADLEQELNKATVVSKDDFPRDVVRVNSVVRIKAADTNEILDLKLVTPDKADIKKRKISIMAPIGTALIGFRKGQQVQWQVPAGKKTFTILEVINEW